ncbi:bifunctional diguanylate cyclase/phosphodiesterase [Rheinheimera sp.]|uniref:bifunctional diguanylate cyclase/phosphodiesterase n=1 Tax=Rheinheimera sp. TaxID=1869214 RepID=UPI0027B91A5D|nr:bifunctional diguanylate cyclase/phosphodiesterase [Rheinheimera sp.]
MLHSSYTEFASSFVLSAPGIGLVLILALVLIQRWSQQRLTPVQKLSLDSFFSNCPCAVWLADADFNLQQANPAAAKLQWQEGNRPQYYQSKYCQQPAWPDIAAELQYQQHWHGVVWLNTQPEPRAMQLWITRLADKDAPRYLVVQHDISAEQQQQAQLQQLSTHDALTGLSNRTLWLAQLEPVLKQCQASQRNCAVALLELTELNQIRQQFGNQQALILECWVAEQLQQHLPPSAVLGQFSERRFALIFKPEHCQQQAEQALWQLARQLQISLQNPCPLTDFEVSVQCYIGLAVYPQAGTDSETLVHHASWALQQGIEQQQCITFWQQPGLAAPADWQTADELEQALRQYQFELCYLPSYQLEQHMLHALTVQLAWHSPKRGLLWLPQFAAVAAQSHQLLAIERWQFQQLCQQLWQWRQQGTTVPAVQLELSALQLQQPDLVAYLLHHLQEWQLDPALFSLLIDEAHYLEQPGLALKQMEALAKAGFSLWWLHFGSGQTPLFLMQQQYWTGVVLAASAVAELETDDQKRHLCSCLIRLAASQQLKVSAQQIDNEMQGYLLHVMGCQFGTGDLFGQAQNASQISKILHIEQNTQKTG